MLRGHGALLDPAGHRYTSARHLPGAGGTPPTAVSLESFLPPVLDQNEDGACTGYERAQSDFATLAAQGTPIPMPSPRWPYKIGRAIDRVRGVDGQLPPLTDDGAAPNQVLRGSQTFGLVPCAFDPPDASRPDDPAAPSDHARVNDEPDMLLAEKASVCELTGAYELDEPTPEAQILLFRQTLASYRCVGFTLPVTGAIDAYTNGILTGAALDGPSRGLHRVLFYGYEILPDGSLRVFWRNHWSKSFGIEGNAVGDESFLLAVRNMIVANVRRR